jgi:hypothetical protein
MEDCKNANDSHEKPRDLVVLDAILAAKPTLYANVSGRPMIEIPLSAAPEAREAWSLDSARAQAYISLFAYRLADPIVLRDREVSQIVRVLKGIAWKSRRVAVDLCQAFDEAPLIEALYTLLTEETEDQSFKGTISELQTELKNVARKLGINQHEDEWPNGPAQLSQLLGNLSGQGALARFGITFERDKDARPRSVELHYLPQGDVAASAASDQSRDRKPNSENGLRATDGDDGVMPSIYQELQAPPLDEMEED